MPTYPALAIGQRLTAALLTSMLPIQVKKAGGTSRNTTTTMTADPELVLPVEANASYRVMLFAKYDAGTAPSSGRLKWSLTGPAGATGDFSTHGAQPTATAYATDQAGQTSLGGTTTMGAAGVGTAFPIVAVGTIIIAGTAGNLSFTWAQADSNATNTTIYAGSYMEIQRIA